MTFEGKQVNIPIKGIIRAGTDNLCVDGSMNEVIGVEYKDGSWLPYAEKHESVVFGTGYTNIVRTFVHKLSDNTTNILVIKNTSNDIEHPVYVLCLATEDTTNTEDDETRYILTEITSNVKDVSFVGNMLCVATDTGNEYYLWKDNAYERQDSTSFPRVDLRVTAGLYDKTESNRIGMRYLERYETENIEDAPLSDERIKNIVIGALTRVSGMVKEEGGLTGYVLACAAYRLKNGAFAMATPPMLLGRPMQVHGGEIGGYFEYNRNSSDEWFDASDDDNPVASKLVKGGTAGGAVTSSYAIFEVPPAPELAYSTYDDTKAHLRAGEAYVKTHTDGYCFADYAFVNSQWRASRLQSIASTQAGISPDLFKDKNGPYVPNLACNKVTIVDQTSKRAEYLFQAYAAANKLQYKISETPNHIENTEIQSLCIFMSDEVFPFDLSKREVEEFAQMVYTDGPLMQFTFELTNSGFVQMYPAKYRTESNVMKEMEKLSSMYLVKEIQRDDITDSDWEDVDLKGILGDSLLVGESLPITALNRTTTLPEYLDAYNFRLHEYNYTQELFGGHDLRSFKHFGGFGQYEGADFSAEGYTYKWEAYVYLKDDNGNSKVVRYDNTAVSSLTKLCSPVISYPSVYADRMEIYVYAYSSGGGENAIRKKEFTFKHNDALGISYYIDPEFKPISLNNGVSGEPDEDVPTESTYNTIRNYNNGLKVSDVAYPSYFPAQFTYRIGNGQIIGLARLTMPLSQDNFGTYQLVIFCTDGIYLMSVDQSGTGAYQSTSYFSNEVCINRDTICEIGGAVVFASNKGLMIITSNGVEEFCPQLNGDIHFAPNTNASEGAPKDGEHIYGKLVTDSKIVGSNHMGDNFKLAISDNDFMEYLNSATIGYISNKHKLLVYGGDKYSYLIDIKTRNTTKLFVPLSFDDGNNVDPVFYTKRRSNMRYSYKANVFEYKTQHEGRVCLIQSRPIKIQQDDKCSYRIVITGAFEGIEDSTKWCELVALGSLDNKNWRVIGIKEKQLNAPFTNFGCLTERGSWKYLMFIFVGELNYTSHIDSIDITAEGRYNNKKR